MRLIEIWEDDYRDARSRGMPDLGDIMPNNHWEFWMRVVEDNYKKTDEIQSEGDLQDNQGLHRGTYDQISSMMRTLLLEKTHEDSEAFLIIKRNNDGLVGYAEIYRYMMELSAEGLSDKTNLKGRRRHEID